MPRSWETLMSAGSPGALVAGTLFQGRYEIVRCLKAGGMGAVYECVHLKTRKHRALKVMLPRGLDSEDMRRRFELEARVTAEIESEHIVETFDAGVDDETGAPFLVMELLRGEDLAELLRERGPFSPDMVVLLLSQAAFALERTHAAGIVHRDLKPENMFVVTGDDGAPRLKLLDFGIAKVMADASRTSDQTLGLGTPLYMSPEQFTGALRIGPQSDLYALGHIAFALLAGRAYWDEERRALPPSYAFVLRVLAGPSEAPSARAARWGISLPAAFDAWFARATARSPDDRFDRATTLVAELAGALGVAAPESRPVPSPRPEERAPARRRVAILTALTFGAALGLLAAPRSRETAAAARSADATDGRARRVDPAPPFPTEEAPAVRVAPAPPEPSAPLPSPASAQPRVGTAAPLRPLASPPASKNCRPPYVIDANGRRQYKAECL